MMVGKKELDVVADMVYEIRIISLLPCHVTLLIDSAAVSGDDMFLNTPDKPGWGSMLYNILCFICVRHSVITYCQQP